MNHRSIYLWLFSMLLVAASLAPMAIFAAEDEVEAAASPATEAQPVAPPALTHYKGREIAQTMHWVHADWLTRTAREREEGVAMLEAELAKKLKPGMTACDLGCGNGYWTLKLARMVGEEGRVYALDIQKEMLEMLEERAARDEVKNITPVLNTLTDTKLPPGSCDLILLVDVYHEFSHPEHMLKSMREALKPDGLIVLVEFRAEDDTVPIKPEHKMSKAQVRKEYEPNGFKLVEEYDELPWQHVMYFKRDDGEGSGKKTEQ